MKKYRVPQIPDIRTDSPKATSRSLQSLEGWWQSFLDAEFGALRPSVGPIIDEMRRSGDVARRALSSANALTRYAALLALEYLWPRDEIVAAQCEKMIRADSHEGVRAAAVIYIGGYFEGTHDAPAATLCATIVASKEESNAIRGSAYESLLRIEGRKNCHTRLYEERTEFPNGVDWKLVREHLR